MNKLLYFISLIIAIAIGFTSCNEDNDLYRNEIGSHISEGHSVCYIPKKYLELKEGTTQLIVNLMPLQGTQEYSITALAYPTRTNNVIQLPLAEIASIRDGKYVMTLKTISGAKTKSKLNVEFKDNLLHCINYVMVSYSFENGTGTLNDPYIISSAEDFDMLKYQLTRDPEKAKGQYFKQTASFVGLNDAGNTDRGFGCDEFAGNYDGGNNTIEYETYASGKDTIDSNLGLFSILQDGAVISNLNIKASLSNTRYNAGGLAGLATGNVKIQNVFYHTHITSYSGYDNSTNVGGLLGKAENATLTINNSGTLDNILNVSGRNNVGGLIGTVVNSNFNIKNVKIEHNISSSNSDLAPLYSSNNYVGGIIGRIVSTNKSSYLNLCETKTAIKSYNNYSGGLIGSINSNYDVNISDCKASSFVSGKKYIGGIAGISSGKGKIQLSGKNEVKNKSISGVSSVGGAFGKFDHTNFSINGETKIMLGKEGIKGSGNKIGGFIGEVVNTVVDFGSNELIFNNALEVNGKMCVGGIVGELSNSKLTSSNSISFPASATTIPKANKFTTNFCGNVTGNSRIGGAVGFATGSTIDGIFANANVSGKDSIGGIVGSAELTNTNCKIENCVFAGSVEATGKDIGGICGKFTKEGNINHCINYGSVNGKENVGGISGAANYIHITEKRRFFERCVNVGAVSGSKDIAGIVGFMHGDADHYVEVAYCANYGEIKGGSGTTGGIAGWICDRKGRIYYSVNHGYVNSSSACRTGGIIGKMGLDPSGLYQSTNLEIGWCANTGNVSCSGDSDVGGIIGFAEEGAGDWNDHDSWVHDCYNTGKISESGKEAGGIIGYSDRYCYLLRLVNYGETDYAIVGDYKYGPDLYDDYTYYTKGEPTKNIADKYISDTSVPENYDGFDFTNTWQIYDKRAILQDSKCPFQNVRYNP